MGQWQFGWLLPTHPSLSQLHNMLSPTSYPQNGRAAESRSEKSPLPDTVSYLCCLRPGLAYSTAFQGTAK